MTGRAWLAALALCVALAAPAMAATGFGGGSGIETDPWIIRTRVHLQEMDGQTGWFRLDRDIDLGGKKVPWTPIAFEGHFDGKGHAITGMYVDEQEALSGSSSAGLFDSVTNGSIKSLTVHGDVSATADDDSLAGGIVASLSGSTIKDCHFVGTVSATATGPLLAPHSHTIAGGVVGYSTDSSIQGCTASGKVTTKSDLPSSAAQAAGGIVGVFQGYDKDEHVLTGCVSNVDIAQSGPAVNIAGGVAGAWFADPPYDPSGNSWYGKGADMGVTKVENSLPSFPREPSDDGAKKGTGAKILSRWLPEGRTGKAYDAQVVVAGTPKSWSISSGTLPEGLTFSNGAVKGVPTKTGRSTFTVKAGSSEQKFSIQIRNGSSNLDIETLELRPTAVGADYLAELEASGNVGAVTWRIIEGELPEGVELSGSAISGAAAPGTAGTYTFTVMAQDSKGNGATQELTLTVTDGGGQPPVMQDLTPPTLRWSPQQGGVVSLWLEGQWTDNVTEQPVEGVTEAWTVNGTALTPGDDGRVAWTVPAGTTSVTVEVVGTAPDGRTGTLSQSVSFGGGGEDPSGKKSGGGGCDMGLGGLAMIALAGAATRRKR